MATELKWCEGTPKLEDIYLVAIDLGPGAGYFDMCYWDGKNWSYQFPEQIIAFISFNSLKQQLDIQWPRPEPAHSALPPTQKKDYGENPWIEEC